MSWNLRMALARIVGGLLWIWVRLRNRTRIRRRRRVFRRRVPRLDGNWTGNGNGKTRGGCEFVGSNYRWSRVFFIVTAVMTTVGTYSHVQLIAFNLLDFISVSPCLRPSPESPFPSLLALPWKEKEQAKRSQASQTISISIGQGLAADCDFSRCRCNCSLSVQFDLIFPNFLTSPWGPKECTHQIDILFNILVCVLRCVFCPPGHWLSWQAGRMCAVVPIANRFVFCVCAGPGYELPGRLAANCT